MPLHFPAHAPDAQSALRALPPRLLLDGVTTQDRGIIHAAGPIPVYSTTLAYATSQRALHALTTTTWRYFLISRQSLSETADVRCLPNEEPRLHSITADGANWQEALTVAEHYAAKPRRTFTLAALHLPEVHLVALWLQATEVKNDAVVLLQASYITHAPYQVYPVAELRRQFRQAAKLPLFS